jgi:hypothetical protein
MEGEIGRNFFKPVKVEDLSMYMIKFVRKSNFIQIRISLSLTSL